MSAAPASSDPLSASDDDDHVRRALLAILLGHTRTAVAGNLAVCAVTTVVLAGSGFDVALGIWAVAIVALMAVRVVFARRLRLQVASLDPDGLSRAEGRLVLLFGLSGLGWGLLPWLGYTGSNAFLDFYSVAMLVGMTGGAVTSTNALPRALNIYLLTALLPFVLRSVMLGDAVSLAGGLTVLFALFVMFSFGRTTYASLRRTLLVTRQNERFAQALRAERDAVTAAMRAKDLFQAGVTHDLRQPVHAIALHLRYLRSLDAEELRRPGAAEIWDGVDAALRTISDQLSRLLELSRLESGEVQPAPRPVVLDELLRGCVRQFAPLARDKGLALRGPRIGRHVADGRTQSDMRMLQSILDNLLSNAVRYTASGGVLVCMRPDVRGWRVQVHDTGPGIPAPLLPLLFEPYRRFDDRAEHADTGHGLGLALARKQAELLGCTLVVRSRPGHGSSFTLRIPLAAPGT